MHWRKSSHNCSGIGSPEGNRGAIQRIVKIALTGQTMDESRWIMSVDLRGQATSEIVNNTNWQCNFIVVRCLSRKCCDFWWIVLTEQLTEQQWDELIFHQKVSQLHFCASFFTETSPGNLRLNQIVVFKAKQFFCQMNYFIYLCILFFCKTFHSDNPNTVKLPVDNFQERDFICIRSCLY